jgi:hypothetical protein
VLHIGIVRQRAGIRRLDQTRIMAHVPEDHWEACLSSETP